MRVGAVVEAKVFHEVRRQTVIEGCKWDAQVGDESTLAPFPVLMGRSEWERLTHLAEQLADETLKAERVISGDRGLIQQLGLPAKLRKLKWSVKDLAPGPRVMRFDFHFTPEGWRISEVNSDVPGGYAEASSFTRQMAAASGEGVPAGDPAAALVEALAAVSRGRPVVLLAPVGYLEDWQVVCLIRRRLQERGVDALLGAPERLAASGWWGRSSLSMNGIGLGAAYRFFLAQWLPGMGADWARLFLQSDTPVMNPGVSVLSESKRMSLLRPLAGVPMPAWDACLPETRDPREVPWQTDGSWLVKAALSDTGESVGWAGGLPEELWKRLRDRVLRAPGDWVAQRRFETVAIDTPLGAMHPCVGVYVIEGKAHGAYLRLARGPIVDYRSIDAALLITED